MNSVVKKARRSDGWLVEQGVDETAHLKIANVLLDYEPPQTLVLVAGDGNDSDFGTSFTKQTVEPPLLTQEMEVLDKWDSAHEDLRQQSAKGVHRRAQSPGRMPQHPETHHRIAVREIKNDHL